nr:MBOAT family protein [Oscillospiraceae bacterium]
MSFTSISFLLFLLCVVAVYYLVPKKYQWVVLLAASYGFYLSGGIGHVFYILGTTFLSYGAARLMQKHRDAFQAEVDAKG